MATEREAEAARTEFWRVLAIKERTVEDAWLAAVAAVDTLRRADDIVRINTEKFLSQRKEPS